jgi:hypothetical protein
MAVLDLGPTRIRFPAFAPDLQRDVLDFGQCCVASANRTT